jgi:DNA (cytosine-5)-methyltransferase 1
MKAFSLFSGIGGFELGFEQAGIPVEWIGYSEIDPFAISIYESHFSHPNYGDIRTIDPNTLPDFDLLVGGFPCQSFSSLGRRRGFDDTRGLLFFEITRLLRHKKPSFVLLENVKGLLSNDKGQTFRLILKALDELGYHVLWQVCNSKDFGVPQHRERIYLIGFLGDQPPSQIFPVIPSLQKAPKHVANEPLPVMSPQKTAIRKSCRRFKTPGEPMFTLTAGDRHGILYHGRIRLLTPLEYERLQGFPDGWTAHGIRGDRVVGISDTQRYKCLGNAVTVNVVAAIASRVFSRKKKEE